MSKAEKLKRILRKQKAYKSLDIQKIRDDDRFSQVLTDRRFLQLKTDHEKVKIGERFKGILKDKSFQQHSRIDKYGRKIKKEKNSNDRLFYQEKKKKDEVGKTKNGKEEKKEEVVVVEQQEVEVQIEEEDEGESTETSAADLEELEKDQNIDEIDLWQEDENVQYIEETEITNRLALINYDWQHIKATDIFSILSSFKPTRGHIERVDVYKSEFGKKQLIKEELQGPTTIWSTETPHREVKPITEERDEWIIHENQKIGINPTRLRQYEKQRLRYYFAVVTLDTKRTANSIYMACNGVELEKTSMKMDLSFVNDSQKFADEATDSCTTLEAKGKMLNFHNRALQHSAVKLTWEQPDPTKFDIFFDDKLSDPDKQIDYDQYLGDVSDDNPADLRANLLGTGDPLTEEDWRADFDKGNKEEQDTEVIIKWNVGFGELQKKIEEKDQNKVTKKPLQQKDYFVDERSLKREQKRRQEELELLVDKELDPNDFKPDLKDTRFTALKGQDFFIDPTSANYEKERSKKRH